MTREIIQPVDLTDKRRLLGLSQIELAEKLGVTNNTISCLERGQFGMSFDLALRCVDLFGSLRVRRGDQVYRLSRHGLVPVDQRSRRMGDTDADDVDDSGFTAESALALLHHEQREAVAVYDELGRDVMDSLAAGYASEHLARLVKEMIADPVHRARLASKCVNRIDPMLCAQGWRLSRDEFVGRGLIRPLPGQMLLFPRPIVRLSL